MSQSTNSSVISVCGSIVAQPRQFRVINIKNRRDLWDICVLNTVGAVVCDHGNKLDESSSNLKRGNFDF